MDEFANTANRIKGYLEDLVEFEGSDLSSKRDYYAASMIAFSIINESIRLAELFMAKRAMAAPVTYKEIFDILLSKKALSSKTAYSMKLLVQKRNLIAHEYGEVRAEDVRDIIGKVEAVKSFMAELAGKY